MRYYCDNKPENMYKVCLAGTDMPLEDLPYKKFRQLVFGDAPQEKACVASTEESWLDKPIEVLELSTRPQNCLARANIHTVEDLCNMTEGEVKRIYQMGGKSVLEIKAKLKVYGLELKVG